MSREQELIAFACRNQRLQKFVAELGVKVQFGLIENDYAIFRASQDKIEHNIDYFAFA